NLLYNATNVLNTRVNVDLAGATNLLYNATNVLNTRVNVDLAGATNALYKATNALNIRVNVDLVGATNVLNTAVTNLNARTNYWNNGVIIYQGTNTGLVAGNLYYLDGNTNWTSASASTNATAKGLIGLALGTTVANGLLLNGQYPTNTSFVSGAILYIDTNNCAITTNAPFQTNNVVRIVGYVINTSTIMFNPDRTYIEVLGQ
ncbi:MAG: hypothetical protein Q8O57_01555, partial [Kiritimatiellota bacterium]|nr:hypothetical protein [Kiritimatiellota bacterium]